MTASDEGHDNRLFGGLDWLLVVAFVAALGEVRLAGGEDFVVRAADTFEDGGDFGPGSEGFQIRDQIGPVFRPENIAIGRHSVIPVGDELDYVLLVCPFPVSQSHFPEQRAKGRTRFAGIREDVVAMPAGLEYSFSCIDVACLGLKFGDRR